MNDFVERAMAIAHSGVGMAVLAADQNFDPLFFGLALLIAVGGGLAVLSAWWVWGRDPEVGAVAEFVTAPPADLPPAVAGALVDKRVDREDIVATLADLGRRDVLRIAPVGVRRSGQAHDFKLSLIGKKAALAPFERRLLEALFGQAFTQVTLSAVRYSFAAARPEIVRLINDELVRRGYFANRPSRIRIFWLAPGVVLMVVAVLAFWVANAALVDVAPTTWWMPGIALLALGGLISAVSRGMPRRTPSGAAAAAQWRAFARHLETIGRFERLREGRELFERYLPYAIAFGIERSWIAACASAGTATPRWYGAGSSGSPADGTGGAAEGWEARLPAGDGSWAMPDFQGWSDQAGASLQATSGSLFDWFDSAGGAFAGDGGNSSGDGGDGGGNGGGDGGGE